MVQIGRYEALIINGWINIHMISRGNPCFHLADTLRELQKFTSKKIEVTIRQNVFESKKTECHGCFKKPASIQNGITIISFCTDGGSRKTLLLANPRLAFSQRVLDFLEFFQLQRFLKPVILISIVNF